MYGPHARKTTDSSALRMESAPLRPTDLTSWNVSASNTRTASSLLLHMRRIWQGAGQRAMQLGGPEKTLHPSAENADIPAAPLPAYPVTAAWMHAPGRAAAGRCLWHS